MSGTARPGLSPSALFALKLTGSVLFTVVLLGVVEIVAGLFAPPIVAREIPGDSVSRTVTYIEVNPAPLVRDVDLLWRNQPSTTRTQPVNPRAFGRDDQWTIENNSEGFRGPERTATPAGTKVLRVLCVGDSITFGFSVDQGDTYPEQLRRLLQSRYPQQRFEIINAGVPGWSWLQGLRFLDLDIERLKPDVVVIGHGTNDQLFPSRVTDDERFLRLASPATRFAQRVSGFAAETNLYRAISRLFPERPIDQPSAGCREQIVRTGSCRRVSVEQIASAVHEVYALAKAKRVDLLVANTDFVQTPAIGGVRSGVEADHVPFVDLVDQVTRLREDDENARADRLGLSRASPPQGPKEDRSVVLRVQVPDPKQEYRVDGVGYFRPDFRFAEALFDDGTHGDERAGDGVFSTTVQVPAEFSAIEYKYHQGSVDEFAAIPPLASTLGDRVLKMPGSRIGPVEVFGQSLFMVERAHPNRDGHQVISRLIADKLKDLPAFRGLVETAAGAGGARAGS